MVKSSLERSQLVLEHRGDSLRGTGDRDASKPIAPSVFSVNVKAMG